MNWASRRRTIYIGSIALFFGIVLGIPFVIWLKEPPTCFDGTQNQEETAVDKGGPCTLLDERTLLPYAVLWSRAFPVRSGGYNAVAYVENPNAEAAARDVAYRFRFYDNQGVLVAERSGATPIMPGGITPVLAGGIATGNRTITRTFFEFLTEPVWERAKDPAEDLAFSDRVVSTTNSTPRLTSRVKNTSVNVITDPAFVAVVFNTAGNAFVASGTTLPRLEGGEEGTIVFTWFEPFSQAVGRIDILPVLEPVLRRD